MLAIDLFFCVDLLMNAVNFIRQGISGKNKIYTIKPYYNKKLTLKKLKTIEKKQIVAFAITKTIFKYKKYKVS